MTDSTALQDSVLTQQQAQTDRSDDDSTNTSGMPEERVFKGVDHPEEACAVFGVYAPGEDVARMAYFALHALQHRGQESAGIAVGDSSSVTVYKDMGLVTQVFTEDSLNALTGDVAIGHVRYSTSGGKDSWDNAQPHLSAIGETIIALAHNGTLVNTNYLRAQLLSKNIPFRSTTDSEVAAKLIGYYTQKTNHLREGIRRTMSKIEGAYAMALITSDALYAFRDPNGIRPLVLGELSNDRGWAVASETCGLDIIGAKFIREIRPGEVLRISKSGVISEQAAPARLTTNCVFEQVYFARPDSVMDGATVYESRVNMGRTLAREAPVDADLVIGVPDSGIPGAIGYSLESGIPYQEGIVKNRYVGRTFIQPSQALRQLGIRLKLTPLRDIIKGKRLIVIDDSIVRGNTSKQLVQMLREDGASEVHLRIVSPQVRFPCFYGIDTDTQDQLIAANLDDKQICAFTGADSLAYLSQKGMVDSIHSNHQEYCCACFDGLYPVPIPKQMHKNSFAPGYVPQVLEGASEPLDPLD